MFKVKTTKRAGMLLFDGKYLSNGHWLLLGCFVDVRDVGIQRLVDDKKPFTYNYFGTGELNTETSEKDGNFTSVLKHLDINSQVKLSDTKITYRESLVMASEDRRLIIGVFDKYAQLTYDFSLYGISDTEPMQLRTHDGKEVVGCIMPYKLDGFKEAIYDIINPKKGE